MSDLQRMTGAAGSAPSRVPADGGMLGDWAWDSVGQAGHTSNEAGQNQGVFRMLMDRMAGRWRYAIPLAIILGASLSFFGYTSTQPMFESSGIIRVAPKIQPILRETAETGVIPFYVQFVQSQAQLITSPRVIDRAYDSLNRSELPWEDRNEAIREIRRGLSARANRQSELISVRFTAETARTSQAVLNAVLQAYDELYGSVDDEDVRLKLQALTTIRNEQRTRLTQVRNEIQELTSTTGYALRNFTSLIEQKALLIFEHEAEIRRLENTLRMMRSDADSEADVIETVQVEPTEEQLRRFDPQLARLAQLRDQAEINFVDVSERFSPQHHAYGRAAEAFELRQRQYLERRESARQSYLSQQTGGGEDPDSEAGVVRRLQILRAELASQREYTRELSDVQLRLEDLRAREQTHEQELNDANRRIRELEIESDAIRQGRITIAAMADRPTAPNKDQRRARAVLGLMGGIGAGIGIFFLLGSIDRRAYAVSQIPQDHHAPRVLGILPALPKSGADPEASAVAAHCVHQIRNHVETLIRGLVRTPVIAVSSAYQGDGKTSLTLALGASYAASGYRTIIVDSDLVGQSLTYHCHMEGEPGFKEHLLSDDAATSGPKPIPMNGLHVLPVGIDANVGPQSLRRSRLELLLASLREQYEVILLDTGPFPGSVESLPIVTSADGVIFALWRGRRWTRLQESVTLLRNMGGTCLGVVLNHARASDCEQYVSKSSISAAVPREHQSNEQRGHGARRSSRDRNVLLHAVDPGDPEGHR